MYSDVLILSRINSQTFREFEVWFLKHILHLPIAVWTLRTPDALKKGTLSYDMQIFEKKKMYY